MWAKEKLAIGGLDEARIYSMTFEPTKILSLAHEGMYLNFRDYGFLGDHTVIMVDDECDPFHSNAPTIDHVKQILEFGKTIKDDDKVLIHCMAGISRSTAAALLISIQRDGLENYSIQDHFQAIKYIRPIAFPNPVILDKGAIVLNIETKDLLSQLSDKFFNKDYDFFY